MNPNFALAIHGGAGTILKSKMTPNLEQSYKQVLKSSLKKGQDILKGGGSALLAVEAAVQVLEDSDLFNAGKGSVFNSEGSHELEASIMCGNTLQAGAVAGVKYIKNPVTLSKKILESPDYVYLSGNGAQKFALENGIKTVPSSYFYSVYRFEQWKAAKKDDTMMLDHSGDKKFGTVGAVALDVEGNLAAATSTGGLTNKKYGRLGDSSVIGSGTYANNKTCAISCTGYGEQFLRGVVAYDISCLMEYKSLSLEEAAKVAIMEKQEALGGEGGIIGLDQQGNISLVFNSAGMYRGKVDSISNNMEVAIYK